ncbi:MAG: MBL fold metallo-hydrolase [Candidatus Thorarchaeota archaeon]|jgi:ribonuclease Z
MGDLTKNYRSEWENDEVRVEVPFSAAGVATTIVLTSKFTGKMMLLDIGDGVLRDLLLSGNTDFVNEIDPIAISHGHFDHVGGLHSLLGFMLMMDRKKPLNILIPCDCKQAIGLIKGFRENYKETLPFKIWYHEMSEGSGFDTDFFKVKSMEVEHYSLERASEKEVLEPSLGYRVQIGETVVGYSGDTRLCSGVEAVVRDADLAIIEATRKKTPAGPRVHLSVSEAEELGKLAKEYLLIHTIPELPS